MPPWIDYHNVWSNRPHIMEREMEETRYKVRALYVAIDQIVEATNWKHYDRPQLVVDGVHRLASQAKMHLLKESEKCLMDCDGFAWRDSQRRRSDIWEKDNG